MGSLAADLRYAVRTLRKSPGFTAVAVAALTLGIGANTAIFTVVNAVLLDPLPYPQPDRIMKLGRQYPQGKGYPNSIPKYMTWRHNQVFEAMALYDMNALSMNLGTSTPPDAVKVLHVSQEYFKVLGVPPLLGRAFTSEEDLPNGPTAAVLSYSVWQSRFGADRNLIGRTVLLNSRAYPVVGVMPQGFRADVEADVFLPMQADPNSANQGHYLWVAGRLKPGVSVGAAQAQMKIVGEQFRRRYPKFMDPTESVLVTPLRDAMVGDVRTALLVLLGAVVLVLLIACANVANLLLARAAGRQHELAIRTAVGASRGRVIRQLLTESVVLAALGGIFGFTLGAWGVKTLLAIVPGNLPRLSDFASGRAGAALPLLDWRVAAFTMAVAVLTGVLFGIFPAWQASRADVLANLKEASGRSGTGLRHNRARSVLVVSEVALAMLLLIGAALLIRSYAGLQNVNPGLDPHNILTLQTSLGGSTYTTTAKVDNLATQALRRLESIPGVEAATVAMMLPIEGGADLPFLIAGRQPVRGDYSGDCQWRTGSADYFQVFHIPLVRGRVFTENDTGNSPRVVVINEAMAKKYWPNEDPLGQVITIGKGLGPQYEEPPRQIIGIVGNVREQGLARENPEVMYVPQSQVPDGMTRLANTVIPLSWAVRTKGEPMAARTAIEQELRSVAADLPIARERTMEQIMSENVARQNFNTVLLSIFAGVALILAAIGIYGLMSYSVQQRTQEIGIRMALGADRGGMLGMVLAQGLKLALAGVVLGLGLAYGLTRLLASLLFGVKASDPVTFGVVAGILTLVALIAALVPARRATTVDPAIALRYE